MAGISMCFCFKVSYRVFLLVVYIWNMLINSRCIVAIVELKFKMTFLLLSLWYQAGKSHAFFPANTVCRQLVRKGSHWRLFLQWILPPSDFGLSLKYYNILLSMSTLERRLVQYNLKRNKGNINLPDVERLIRNELDGPGKVSGYRGTGADLEVSRIN